MVPLHPQWLYPKIEFGGLKLWIIYTAMQTWIRHRKITSNNQWQNRKFWMTQLNLVHTWDLSNATGWVIRTTWIRWLKGSISFWVRLQEKKTQINIKLKPHSWYYSETCIVSNFMRGLFLEFSVSIFEPRFTACHQNLRNWNCEYVCEVLYQTSISFSVTPFALPIHVPGYRHTDPGNIEMCG